MLKEGRSQLGVGTAPVLLSSSRKTRLKNQP